ncbi:MAG TPA: GNAT family N-acetyltransferase [Gemmatimonadota bacterium]|jgi:GNAT superfamily N-acetyltransferase
MTVREARLDDAAALARLATELGYPTTVEEASRRAADVLARPGHAVFVAEVEGEVAGWIHVVESVTLESDRSAEIGGLVVGDAHRGVGIGARLVAEAERWAGSRGYRLLRVRSNVTRVRARRFYEREGFAVTKSQNHFVKPLAT